MTWFPSCDRDMPSSSCERGVQRDSVLINTACFPPRQVFWQQSKDSLKAGQSSLSKVLLSPNNGTNSMLTWMLLQEVPETRQCWENQE